jgi:hypothetical protein
MTDIMTVGGPGAPLPGPRRGAHLIKSPADLAERIEVTCLSCAHEEDLTQRVADLEQVCLQQQHAITFLLNCLTKQFSRDIKERIRPGMNLADELLGITYR